MDNPLVKENSSFQKSPIISINPVNLLSPGRKRELQVRVSYPVVGTDLPIIIFSHGFGSSKDAYAPLVDYWASHGFVVIQPTFLDSRKFSEQHHEEHNDAIKAYLESSVKGIMWKYRVKDVTSVLDQLDYIEAIVPGLNGRLDRSRIAAVGHSFGAQTTATLLGTRVIDSDGKLSEDLADPRIKAGVLLSVGGLGGKALSPFAKEHFPHLNQSYAEMKTQTLVVAGDQDKSPLTVNGPEWFTDAFYESPTADTLLVLFGGEHFLGGISGYLVRETTDENPKRVSAVQQLTLAYLFNALYPNNSAWVEAKSSFEVSFNNIGKIVSK